MTLSPASPNHDARIDKGSPDVEKSEKNPLDDVPDGGFLAWLQIAAAFFIFMNTAGLFNSFGVYQGFYSQVTGPLYDLGYLHSMVNVGTFAITFGMMMTSLCHEYWQFILAQGVVVGIGNGLLFLPSIAVVPQYFSTKKSLASGIVAAGSSVGSIIYPIMFTRVESSIGYQWATRMIAFVMLATSIVSVAGIRSRSKKSIVRRRIFDIGSFRDPPFVYFCLSMFFGFMGFYVLFFYVELYAMQECHMTKSLAPYTIPMANAGAALGRLGPNYLADKSGPLNMYIPFTFITGLLAFCWMAVHSAAGIIVFSVLYGFFSAAFVSLLGPIVTEISTETSDVIGTRLGMALAFAGLGLLIGSPVAGAILTSHGWIGQQAWAGSLIMASGVCLICVRGWRYGWAVKTRA